LPKSSILILGTLFTLTNTTFSQSFRFYDSSGMAKMKVEDYKGALNDLNKAIELIQDASSPSYTYFDRAVIKDQMEDYEGAVQDFKIAIKLDPRLNVCNYNICCMYSMIKDSISALRYLTLALQNGFDDLAAIDDDLELDNIPITSEFKLTLQRYFDQKQLANFPRIFTNSSNYWRHKAEIK
jgi:tetratricopeptide (TPR) repeat protein